MEKLNVGILLYDDVEVLDFAGPFEVFSRTRLTPGAESRRRLSSVSSLHCRENQTEYPRGWQFDSIADETAHYIEYLRR